METCQVCGKQRQKLVHVKDGIVCSDCHKAGWGRCAKRMVLPVDTVPFEPDEEEERPLYVSDKPPKKRKGPTKGKGKRKDATV